MGFFSVCCSTPLASGTWLMPKITVIDSGKAIERSLTPAEQKKLGILLISMDPQRDDPKRLQDYARTFQRGPGWSWLTGTPYAITETLKGLGSFNADLSQHPPLILVGDGRSGHWTRYYGFTDPGVLFDEINRLSARRVHAKSTAIADHHEVQP